VIIISAVSTGARADGDRTDEPIDDDRMEVADPVFATSGAQGIRFEDRSWVRRIPQIGRGR
jgi:hypothetical protein